MLPDEMPDAPASLPEVDQIGFVVEDIESTARRYTELLGVGPWEGYRFEPPGLVNPATGDPADYGMVLAFADVGDLQLELIESTIGPNLYDEFLEDHGEGIHHLAYYADSRAEFDDIAAGFRESGVESVFGGEFGGSEFHYFDASEELGGLLYELVYREDVSGREPEFTYPPTGE